MWSKSDNEAFEKGMRTYYKEFSPIKKHVMSIQLLRYSLWLNRKHYTPVSTLQNIYSAQSAPIKYDEPNRHFTIPDFAIAHALIIPNLPMEAIFGGPHLHILLLYQPPQSPPQVVNGNGNVERTLTMRVTPNMGVFDVSVYAGID